MNRLLKTIQYLFLGVALLLMGKFFLHLFDERYISCKANSDREKTVCTIIVKHMSWWINGHTFSPTYGLAYSNFRDAWCELKLIPQDADVLKSLMKHEKFSVSKAAGELLSLLEERGQTGTIFDVKSEFYILKDSCDLPGLR